jgi:hypothetical protein
LFAQHKNGRYENSAPARIENCSGGDRQTLTASWRMAPSQKRRLHLAMQPCKKMEAQDMEILRFL